MTELLKINLLKTVVERYIQLKAVNAVDEIVPYTEQDLEDILRSFVIDLENYW